ncbi:MAG: elongation factor P maturation arginine rhamnosyltransferase EarP [Polaromonas sp.]
MDSRTPHLQWDIFCRVIDNFGDIGVCWRLTAELAARGQRVRLWVDDARALAWMAPDGVPGVQVLPWPAAPALLDVGILTDPGQLPTDVIIEAFGCELAPEFIAECARISGAKGRIPAWINLEYLTAEAYAARNHGLPSPVQSGPAAGWIKHFFYPGFNAGTGGLLRESNVGLRQAAFNREDWLRAHGVTSADAFVVSLFCYEPAVLASLLAQLAAEGFNGRPVHLLVAAGRAQAAVRTALNADKTQKSNEKCPEPAQSGHSLLSISYLPLLSQDGFDELLWACDLNFVRGEDSLVRAIWAGKPFVWQIYPQDDGAHHIKLEAFLDMLDAPASLRKFHTAWNAANGAEAGAQVLAAVASDLGTWQQAAVQARARLAALPDLTASLLQFVQKNR